MAELSIASEREDDEDFLTLEEIMEAIKKIKRNKAIDNVSDELIKDGEARLATVIHDLLCKIWRQETLPKKWRAAIIYPIHKKRNRLLNVEITEVYRSCA